MTTNQEDALYKPSDAARERGDKQHDIFAAVLGLMADSMIDNDMTPYEVIGSVQAALSHFTILNSRSMGLLQEEEKPNG